LLYKTVLSTTSPKSQHPVSNHSFPLLLERPVWLLSSADVLLKVWPMPLEGTVTSKMG
jgi:hypothetical protein